VELLQLNVGRAVSEGKLSANKSKRLRRKLSANKSKQSVSTDAEYEDYQYVEPPMTLLNVDTSKVFVGRAVSEGKLSANKSKQSVSTDGDPLIVNTSKVWSELRAAVNVDKLKAELQTATAEQREQLQAQLEQLQEHFPSSEELKQQFASQWTNITEAMDVEALQDQLDAAVTSGSAQAEQLRGQLEALKGKLPDDVLGSVQNQAAATWGYLQERGVSLPNLDALSHQAEILAKQADTLAKQAEDLSGSVAHSVGDVANSVGDALGGLFR